MDDDNFLKCGTEMLQFIIDYYNKMASKIIPVMPPSSVKPTDLIKQMPTEAPENPEDFQAIMRDVCEKIIPNSTHWHHPNFYAYFPTSTSYPSIIGDMLSDAIACVGFSWIASPACTELEVLTLDWMVKSMGLPKHFLSATHLDDSNEPSKGGGVIQMSASAASLMIILSLRSMKLREIGQVEQQGSLVDKMVVYLSDQAHSSVERACRIALVKSHIIETFPGDNYTLNAQKLKEEIAKDLKNDFIPLVCFATMGTTNSCAFDNIKEITSVCQEFDLWCHVDAAYAGSALVCPEYRHLVDGIEKVDSFNYNAHKMQRVTFDCSILWVKDRTVLNNSFNIDPTYLQHDFEGMPDFRISLGRRFRALKLWFVVRTFGLEGLRSYIRNHCRLAKLFESYLRQDQRFQIVNQVDMGLVCFRLNNSDENTKKLYELILEERNIYLVPGSFKNSVTNEKNDGYYFLRFTVGSYLANDEDILHAYHVISKNADKELLKAYSSTPIDRMIMSYIG